MHFSPEVSTSDHTFLEISTSDHFSLEISDSRMSLLSNCHIVPTCHVPYFQTCTLSHACHVTELFKCELPVDYVDPHHICISIILRTAIMPCFPQYNCTHQNFKEKLCPELDGPRAETAPRPLRTHRLTPLAFAPPRTPIYCENTGIRTLPYFQTATSSHACQFFTFNLVHYPTPAT